MFMNPAMSAALDRIAERAADVRRAFTPGALPRHDDVARPGVITDFTLDPLAVTPPEGAYFVTRDEKGGIAYTRDGSFALRGGELVDAAGRPVCGIGEPGEAPRVLRVDPVDEALGRVDGARVDRDGSFLYRRETIDPRSGIRESQRIVVGRVVLARFPAGTRLTVDDAGESLATPQVAPELGVPGDANFAPVVPQRRERSRIDIDQSLIRLKDAYIAFDALQAAEAANGHLKKTTMDLVK